ncbi:hypothetical protein EVAR_82691_1 [Eumeta japonica]|uniref:Uncharacterized protein n=1 Tax=Eumeta variegata TaxID=151549 RepID=A0A4C1VAN0_EUMVA|nr:hypothetical protein EVAR_82691_1 [Eumeta japonica]
MVIDQPWGVATQNLFRLLRSRRCRRAPSHLFALTRLCAAAVSLLLGRIGRCSGREIARSALSLARSAQAERDNECVQMAFIGL